MKLKTIEDLSEQIDNILEEEHQTSKFATSNLREYASKILQSSHHTAMEDLGPGIGGGLAILGIMAIGSISSNDNLVDGAKEQNKEHQTSQHELDKEWANTRFKINSLSINELSWILYVNRKNGFLQALSCLKIQ